MCRLVFYKGGSIPLSSLLTEPRHSIIHQSYHSKEREEPLNGDGFGVAWYTPDVTNRAAVFKSVSPAWNNQNLLSLAPVISSACIVAHIRAATPGLPVTHFNTHPFTWNGFTFVHNGEIGGFQSIKRAMRTDLSDETYAHLQGTTDSEHLFALFIDAYRSAEGANELEVMAGALIEAIRRHEVLKVEAEVDEPSLLNLVLTDGHRTVVTRYISDRGREANSLYLHQGAAYECIDRVCRMREAGASNDAVLVASEPLSEDEGWRRVNPNTVLLIDEDLSVHERAIDV